MRFGEGNKEAFEIQILKINNYGIYAFKYTLNY